MPEAPATAARLQQLSLTMLAGWMGERYFRTFRPRLDEPTAFDALLGRRDARIGVTCGLLWEDGAPPGAEALEEQLSADLEETPGAYVLWLPPGAELPDAEPRQSELRLIVGRAFAGLAPAQRRELRLPVTLALAKVEAEGSYVSVSGPLAAEWTTLSEGIDGAFHLDARALRRLPEERAELDIVLTRIRDRAGLLAPEEITPVEVHDYWLVSRLPADEPAGATVFGAAPNFNPIEGAVVRRVLRAQLRRAGEQRAAAAAAGEQIEMTALVLGAPHGHIEDELATAALRGMSPAVYGGVDLVVLVADGSVRQVLQPRSLPWEAGD